MIVIIIFYIKTFCCDTWNSYLFSWCWFLCNNLHMLIFSNLLWALSVWNSRGNNPTSALLYIYYIISRQKEQDLFFQSVFDILWLKVLRWRCAQWSAMSGMIFCIGRIMNCLHSLFVTLIEDMIVKILWSMNTSVFMQRFHPPLFWITKQEPRQLFALFHLFWYWVQSIWNIPYAWS